MGIPKSRVLIDGRKLTEIKTRGQQVYLKDLDIPVYLSWVWLKRNGKREIRYVISTKPMNPIKLQHNPKLRLNLNVKLNQNLKLIQKLRLSPKLMVNLKLRFKEKIKIASFVAKILISANTQNILKLVR